MLVKGYKVSVIRWIRSRELMCNKVTIIIIQYCILKIYEEGRYLVFSSHTHTHTHTREVVDMWIIWIAVIQFSSVAQSCLTRCDPWPAAGQASLSITNSHSPPKPMSIESVMPSNHLILLSPSPPALNLSQDQGLFKWVSSLHQVALFHNIWIHESKHQTVYPKYIQY